MVMQKKSLGEVLVEKGALTEDQLRQAHDVQKSAPGDLGNIIVDLGFASERDVASARATEMGLPFVDLTKNYPIDPEAVRLVPEHIAKRYNVLPLRRDAAGKKLWVAVGETSSEKSVPALDDIRIVSRHTPLPVLAAPGDLEDAIIRIYSNGAAPVAAGAEADAGANGTGGRKSPAGPRMQAGSRAAQNGRTPGGSAYPVPVPDESAQTPANIDATLMGVPANVNSELSRTIQGDLLSLAGAGDDEDEEALRDMAEDAPIIRVAHTIITQAIREGASDIHIEPETKGVRIRYRIDGVLNEIMTVPKHIRAPLISRYKILADLNIAERRVPQDGRIAIRFENKEYDLRVSTIPTQYGEKVVMRILDKTGVLLGLSKLGFTPEIQHQLEELVTQPQGMVLTTGPTGSGKTTTLYSVLNKISTSEVNVLTIEDPVEYQLPGIAQVQINTKAGLTFAKAMRAFLRQDPDIIMVGEMRDLETANTAVEASLTGHLVLSTLHTNDSPSAVMRLADMGVETYLIAATVTGVMAQRLARRICPQCREPYEVPASHLRRYGYEPPHGDDSEMVTLYKGAGCENCKGTGYRGRLGLYELMRMNEEIAELVVRRAPLADVRDAAKAAGMKELREDGLLKVLKGETTPEEVRRVVFTAGF